MPPVPPTQALNRLTQYNSNAYDEDTNPYGFALGGHRVVFPLATDDVATVGQFIREAGIEIAETSSAVEQWRIGTREDRILAQQAAQAAAGYDPAPFNAHIANTDDPHQARAQAITTLRGGVAAAGDTLAKIWTALSTFIARRDNPHAVTKAQVGLGNVDNTTDAGKPISTATQAALNGKVTGNTAIVGISRVIVGGSWDQAVLNLTDGSARKLVTDISNNRIALWYNPAGWGVLRVDMTDFAIASRDFVQGGLNARVQELRWIPTGVYGYNNAGDSWTGIGGGTPLWGMRIIPENVGGQFYYRPTHGQSTTLQAYREDRGWFTIQ